MQKCLLINFGSDVSTIHVPAIRAVTVNASALLWLPTPMNVP